MVDNLQINTAKLAELKVEHAETLMAMSVKEQECDQLRSAVEDGIQHRMLLSQSLQEVSVV